MAESDDAGPDGSTGAESEGDAARAEYLSRRRWVLGGNERAEWTDPVGNSGP